MNQSSESKQSEKRKLISSTTAVVNHITKSSSLLLRIRLPSLILSHRTARLMIMEALTRNTARRCAMAVSVSASTTASTTSQRWNPSPKRSRVGVPSSLWLRAATTWYLMATTSTSVGGASSFSTTNIAFVRGGSTPGKSGLIRPYSSRRPLAATPTTAASAPFTTHASLSELLREFDYDALILDQFGVLHNGKHALEGTIECVEKIGETRSPGNNAALQEDISSVVSATDGVKEPDAPKKLRLIVLSNTSSPSKTTLERLGAKLGFDPAYFCGAVTSGEEAARHIRETYGQNTDDKTTKRKFVWCTWDPSNENVPDPSAFLELCGPNVEPTVDVNQADFVVAHGSGAIRGYNAGKDMEIVPMGSFLDDGNLEPGTPIHALLRSCAKRKLPLVCANPDLVVQYHDGSLKHMPGKIAQRYTELLTEETQDSETVQALVTIYGKPHTEHFRACLRTLEEDRQKENGQEQTFPLKVAHVGDSLHHDIAGANAAGIPSIFIVGGIHAEELLSEDSENETGMPSEARLRELFAKEGITPTHVLPVFNF